jgi:hypothetical protein
MGTNGDERQDAEDAEGNAERGDAWIGQNWVCDRIHALRLKNPF